MANTSDVTPAVEITTPRVSKRWFRIRGRRGIRNWPRSRVTATIGRLTRKIDPYQKCSSSAPPTTGPKATAMPDTAPQMPSAFCRSDGSSKTVVRMARLAGKMKAAATPISALDPISVPVECDAAAERGEDAEEDEADLHRALAAQPVAHPAAGQEQPGEGEAVRVDDPLQRRDRRAQVPVQRGQGDVDDGVVDDDEKDTQAQHRQDQPAAVAGRRRDRLPLPARLGFGHKARSGHVALPSRACPTSVVERCTIVIARRSTVGYS